MKGTASKPFNRFLVFIIFFIIIIIIGFTFSIDEEKISSFLNKVSIGYATLVFVLLYTVGTFAVWTLKEPLKIIGAILFGAYVSTSLIYIAEIINAVVFFKLSRKFGKDFVERKVGGGFKRFYDKLENIRFAKVVILRANPLIPYRVLDVGFGLSRVSFKKYLFAVLIASPPRIFWLQFPLAAIRGFSIDKWMTYFMEHMHVVWLMFFYLIIVCVTPFFIRTKPTPESK
ncbi:MAG: VTT domain-containing protein [Candidatus Omnitrophota bacterium]|nr:MAG: VTT domain-containing protein [Candidatus Omnitrophota bacterium]